MPSKKGTGKSKGGRPARVLSEKEINQVEALAQYLTIAQIADYLGIAERTFSGVRERQPEVSAAYKRGRARAISKIAGNVVAKALKGDNACMFFYLKTQAGWRETVDITSGDAPLMPPQISVVPAAMDGDNEAGG